MSINHASKTFNIPKTTLLRRFKQSNATKANLGRRCDLPPRLEDELAKHCA